ncbi:MAG: hypothetical protein KBG49_12380, partial [Spirochaetes bacterium]|nr:hypothetical protein [Spirochaetota bacterium]
MNNNPESLIKSKRPIKGKNSFNRLKNRFFLPYFIKEMKRMGIGGISGGNSLQLITRGDDFFDAVISAIDSARKSINLETYIFRSDEVGWIIAEKLAEKASQGLEVNVIYDAFGSIAASKIMFDMM